MKKKEKKEKIIQKKKKSHEGKKILKYALYQRFPKLFGSRKLFFVLRT
jgi:hypothetical protein